MKWECEESLEAHKHAVGKGAERSVAPADSSAHHKQSEPKDRSDVMETAGGDAALCPLPDCVFGEA